MSVRLVADRAPFWIDCPLGVRLHVKPATTALLETARTAAQREARELRAARAKVEECGGVVSDLPDLDDESVAIGVGFELLCRALGRYAITEWQGVLDENDQPASITPDAIAALMNVEPIADAFYRAMTLATRRIDAEKKSSAPEPNGTSQAAGPIAPDATPPASPAPPAPTT